MRSVGRCRFQRSVFSRGPMDTPLDTRSDTRWGTCGVDGDTGGVDSDTLPARPRVRVRNSCKISWSTGVISGLPAGADDAGRTSTDTGLDTRVDTPLDTPGVCGDILGVGPDTPSPVPPPCWALAPPRRRG